MAQRLDAIDKAQGTTRTPTPPQRPSASSRNPALEKQRAVARGQDDACQASQQKIQEGNAQSEETAKLLRFAAQIGAQLRALLKEAQPELLQAAEITSTVKEASDEVNLIVSSYKQFRAAFKKKAKKIIIDLVKKAVANPATRQFTNKIPFAGDIVAGAIVLVEEYLLTGDLESSIKLATGYMAASAAAGYAAGATVGAITGAAVITAPAAPVTAAIADALASSFAGEEFIKKYRQNNEARRILAEENRREAQEDGVVVVRKANPQPATPGTRTIATAASSASANKVDARTANATAVRENQDRRTQITSQNVDKGTTAYRYPMR